MNATISMTNKLRGTVSMANSKINGGASPYPKGASGSIITITDGAENTPLKSAVVNIEPVQDLNGYDYPWPGGGGINKADFVDGYSIDPSGNVVVYTASDRCATVNPITIESGATYYVKSFDNTVRFIYAVYNGSTFVRRSANIASGTALDTSGGDKLYVCAYDATVAGAKPMVAVGSTPTAYAPYSNICPISGWSEVKVWVKPTYDTTLTPTATIPLGRTAYGGTLDAVRGKLNAKPYYASYSGQTLVGPWISSHDKYVAGATPTTGAQVVDMEAVGTDYDVTPQTIKTLLGTNNIWADAGSMEIEYYPAAASIVAVQNRSTKMYVSIPLGMIRYETYQITPQQTIDLDSYRSENGNLLRNPVATKCKLEFNTPLMTDTQWGEIWNIIKAGFNNNTERKLKLKYYDTLSATYKTGYFYVPDVQTTIRNIDEATGTINYNEIRLAFIEY